MYMQKYLMRCANEDTCQKNCFEISTSPLNAHHYEETTRGVDDSLRVVWESMEDCRKRIDYILSNNPSGASPYKSTRQE